MVYPIAKDRPDKHQRGVARQCTSDIRQRVNDRTASQKFRRLIAANFKPGDYVVTLTYSDVALPATPEAAVKQHLRPFIDKLRKYCKAKGSAPLRYMYVTEGLHGDKRLHHHIILPNIPGMREAVKEFWKSGENVGFETIASRGYPVWAGYLTKEPRKTGRHRVGSRMWTPSLHLEKPTVIKFEETDAFVYEPPPGVVIEFNETIRNEWFLCQYLSYRIPSYMSEN